MPSRRSTPKVMHRAGELRRDATPAEKKLWLHLRLLRAEGIHFRRHNVLAFAQEHAIGRYITDFCAPRKKLVIELDGTHHIGLEAQDGERTRYLESQGYKVLRFWNSQVMNDVGGVVTLRSRAGTSRAIVHAMEA